MGKNQVLYIAGDNGRRIASWPLGRLPKLSRLAIVKPRFVMWG
jgi:hypothetical protein